MVVDMTGACARRTPQALWGRAPSVGMHVYIPWKYLTHETAEGKADAGRDPFPAGF